MFINRLGSLWPHLSFSLELSQTVVITTAAALAVGAGAGAGPSGTQTGSLAPELSSTKLRRLMFPLAPGDLPAGGLTTEGLWQRAAPSSFKWLPLMEDPPCAVAKARRACVAQSQSKLRRRLARTSLGDAQQAS